MNIDKIRLSQPRSNSAFRSIISSERAYQYMVKKFKPVDFEKLDALVDEQAGKKPDIHLEVHNGKFSANTEHRSFKAGWFTKPMRAIEKAIEYASTVKVESRDVYRKMIQPKRHY